MPLLNRTPEKYEARALEYERKNKPAKAIKNREKAARIRAQHGSTLGAFPATSTIGNTYPTTGTTTYTTTTSTSPILQSGFNNQTGLLGNQSGLQSGLLGNQTGLQSGLLGNQTGLQSGLLGNQTGLQSGLLGNQSGLQSGLLGNQSGLQSGLLGNQSGLQSGLLGNQTGLQGGLLGNQAGLGNQQWGQQWGNRTPAMYEQNALKWEQRGNWSKAQKNREKYWRMQNPQWNSYAAPQFYQQNRFLGYNQPYGPQLQKPFNGGQQFNFAQGGQQQHFVAPIVEQHVRPTIVEQTMRAERITEVQPIIHREIDAPTVRVIEKHVYETVPSAGPSTITNAPIIQETLRPKIIEEIQPVVHREVAAPFVERVEQHVTEHITNPTITTKQVINEKPFIQQPGFAAGGPLPTQQPILTQQTTTTTTTQPGLAGKVNNILHRQ